MAGDKQNMKATMTIAYVPTPLRSMAEICEALGVGPKTVKAWVEKAKLLLIC